MIKTVSLNKSDSQTFKCKCKCKQEAQYLVPLLFLAVTHMLKNSSNVSENL